MAPDAALEDRLTACWQGGCQQWPEIPLERAAFVQHVRERLPSGVDPAAAVEALHASDLYLACACARGDRAALTAFETHFIARLSAHLASSEALSSFSDEVKQTLRVRLLVAEHELVPRIGTYTGRGPLLGWLRVAATRVAIDLRRAELPGLAEDLGQLRSPAPDPELGYLKAFYRPQLEAAVTATLAALPQREANVFRLFFLDGLSSEELAKLYRVTDRSVQRWIADGRTRLMEETRRRLGEHSDLSGSQLGAVIGLVKSQLGVSVTRLLSPRRGRRPRQ